MHVVKENIYVPYAIISGIKETIALLLKVEDVVIIKNSKAVFWNCCRGNVFTIRYTGAS